MAPTWLQALVLGLVQGLTEFIPVSSSGHLVIVPAYLGWSRPGLAFDVALHFGTLVALVAYYRRDLLAMAGAVLTRTPTEDQLMYRRLAVLLGVATVPVGVGGLLFRSQVELAFDSPRFASVLLLGTAVLLVLGERIRARRLPVAAPATGEGDVPPPVDPVTGADPSDPAGTALDRLTLRQAVLVGLGQAVALLPGLSRSGTTITAGLLAGLSRPAATRFAFLLALPAIVGATVVSLPDLGEMGQYGPGDLAIGMVAAGIAGYAAIAALVRLVSRAGLERFAIYLVVVAAIGLVRFS